MANSSYPGEQYTFAGIAGDQIGVAVTTQSDMVFSLLDPRGVVIAKVDSFQRAFFFPTTGYFRLPLTGTYTLEVAARSSFSTANAYTLNLTQATAVCGYTLNSTRQSFAPQGGTGSVPIKTASPCPWTARTSDSWIKITSGSSGSEEGEVRFAVDANPNTFQRTGTISIVGQSVTIVQNSATNVCQVLPLTMGQTINGEITSSDCPTPLRPELWPTDRYAFQYTAGQPLQLSVAPATGGFNSFYLYVTDDKGTVYAEGSGAVPSGTNTALFLPTSGTYFVDVTTDFANFTGRYTLMLKTPTGCTTTVVQTGQQFTTSGGTGELDVVAGEHCPWTATTTESWITITAGTPGRGSGKVRYSVAPNTATTARRTTISVAGQRYTVEQAGPGNPCGIEPLTIGQRVTGALTGANCQGTQRVTFFKRGPAKRYSFTAQAGDRFLLAMQLLRGNSLPNAYLVRPDGFPVQVDGEKLAAGELVLLPQTGTYLLEVALQFAPPVEYSLAVHLLPSGCGYGLVPARMSFDAAGGGNSVSIVSSSGCPWNALSTASWLELTSPSQGSGNGYVDFKVAPNLTSSTRRGTILVGNQHFTVDQAAAGNLCGLVPITPGQTLNASAGASDCSTQFASQAIHRYVFGATAGEQVALQISRDNFFSDSVMSLFTPDGKLFAQTTGAQLPVNSSLYLPQTGSYVIEITGSYRTLSVLPVASGCSVAVTAPRQAFNSGGGRSQIHVTSRAACDWKAVASADWIWIAAGATGQGTGEVEYEVAPNPGAVARTGFLTVAGKLIKVEQGGANVNCVALPLVAGQTVRGNLSQANCLTATRNSSFPYYTDWYSFHGQAGDKIALLAKGLGSTPLTPTIYLFDPFGTLLQRVDSPFVGTEVRIPATTGFYTLPRTGTYTVEISSVNSSNRGDYDLSFFAGESACNFALPINRQKFEAVGGTSEVAVVSDGSCGWVASSAVDWITVAAESREGKGGGIVKLTIAPNSTTAYRRGTLTIAGQTYTVEQAGRNGNCGTALLMPGVVTSATFTSGDCRSSKGFNPADRYTFTAAAGDQIAVVGTYSNLLDFFLYDSSGRQLTRSETRLRLPETGLFSVPVTGTYTLEVTPFNVSGEAYTVTLFQYPGTCSYSLTPVSQSFEATGGTGSINLVVGPNCNWTLKSDVSWITLQTTGAGTGTKRIEFTVAPNSDSRSRSGTLTIAERKISIQQAGAGGSCTTTTLLPGQSVNGSLTNGDCGEITSFGSSPRDRYVFTGTAGDRVLLNVKPVSNNVSVRLKLVAPSGEIVVSPFSALFPPGGGFYVLPASGEYLVDVSGSVGSYTLNLQVLAAGQ